MIASLYASIDQTFRNIGVLGVSAMIKSHKLRLSHKAGSRILVNAIIATSSFWISQAIAGGVCTVEGIQSITPGDAVIDSATPTDKPVPHCLINGHIISQNPGPNRINFRLQLPDENFNGRYYFIGMGGAAGYVPTDSQLPSGNPITAGFATAGTDTGHTGDILDWSFTRTSPAKTVDHHHRAGHLTAVATQGITRSYYGIDQLYRYHSGCSGGGRMGMIASEMYPGDYDGHLIGAPGRSSATIMLFMWAAQQMLREPGAWVSPAKLDVLEAKVTKACDLTDGAEDGVVWWPDRCDYDPAEMLCKADDQPGCLTAPELKTVKAILEGPSSPAGQITEGMPITNIGSGWKSFVGSTPPPWSESTSPESLAKSSSGFVMGHVISKNHFGPDFDFVRDFDFSDQSDIDGWWDAVKRIGFGGVHTADLRGIEKTGDKALWWHGVSDAGPTWGTSIGYFQDAKRIMGGDANRLAKTARLYLVPGLLHCGGGTGPNDTPDVLLNTLIDWVEKGIEPGDVVLNRGSSAVRAFKPVEGESFSGVRIPSAEGEDREFLVCPYPNRAKFNGQRGGEMLATNWSCAPPLPGDR